MNRLLALETDLANAPSFDETVSTINEISRFGCGSSLPVLVSDAQILDQTTDTSPRMEALIRSFDRIALPDPTVMTLLDKYSTLTLPSSEIPFIATAARRKILGLDLGIVNHPSWYDSNSTCQNYILLPGQTATFTHDWNEYYQAVNNLPPDSTERVNIAKWTRMCDGVSGFEAHKKAIQGLWVNNTQETLDTLKAILLEHQNRGNLVATYIVERAMEIYHADHQRGGLVVDFLNNSYLGANGSAMPSNENARAEAVASVDGICVALRILNIPNTTCSPAMTSLKRLAKEDWASDVRYRSYVGLANNGEAPELVNQ
ncbi:hypothetical protein ACLWBD_12985 [Bdellovibrio sp. HCB117]|uniref:hypothetical protein n=1 Tax=Bdellovibrio sp. HCB117 TaxID=3394359 RepID=UPI0039B5E61E